MTTQATPNDRLSITLHYFYMWLLKPDASNIHNEASLRLCSLSRLKRIDYLSIQNILWSHTRSYSTSPLFHCTDYFFHTLHYNFVFSFGLRVIIFKSRAFWLLRRDLVWHPLPDFIAGAVAVMVTGHLSKSYKVLKLKYRGEGNGLFFPVFFTGLCLIKLYLLN